MMTRQIEGGRMDGTRVRYLRTLLVGLALVIGVVRVEAYEVYDDGTGTYGCVTCHPRFFDDPNSPTPFGSLHVAHLTKFGINSTLKCGQCHMNPAGGDTPVYTFTSAEGFGCAGCHGQNYGETVPTGLGLPNEGAPKASAYGLRKALDDLFAVIHPSDPAPCGSCHFPGSPVTGDPSPAPALFPETVLPPYYGHPELNNLSDPCDSSQENWDNSTTSHLDNDGNGAANYEADSACQAFVPTTTTTTTVVTTSTTSTTLPGAPKRITVYPGQSIQDAVDAVRPGGSVYIMPGTYQEMHGNTNAVTVSKDGIRLIARSKPKQGLKVILQAWGAQTNGLVVQPAVPGTRINGFQVKGLTVQGFPNNGILTRFLDNFKIERNETANNLENGIWPTLSANGLVKRNVSYGSDDAALWVEASENVRVIKNELYDSPTGLEITVSNGVVAKHNDVHDNVVGIGLYHALGAGIPPLQPLDRNGDWEISQNNVHDNNKVNDVTGGLVSQLPPGIGILLVGVDRVKVDRNRVENNKTIGLAIADWCLVASCPNPYPPTLPNAVPEHNDIVGNVFVHNAYDPDPSQAALAADLTVVAFPAPGTTTTDNCFADNTYTTIQSLPPVTQVNRCN
jgi:hypothetical protein